MDVDGTLAPIVERPDQAKVPQETATALRELSGRYAMVACVTGRPALTAREMVGVDELTYVGNQGIEMLGPGAKEPLVEPEVLERADLVAELLADLDWERLERAGVSQEDKGPIQVLHWRGASDRDEAARAAEEVALAAEAAGLFPLWGRMVLELRPIEGVDKGTSVERLIDAAPPLDAALFAGDDRTDLDAFRALGRLARSGRLSCAVRVGVSSDEGPAEIRSEAEIVVEGTEGVLQILRGLARG